jgi:hypothetical protein
MEHSTWDANSYSSTQEITRLLWNTKFHYRVYKIPPLEPILSHINIINNPTYYFMAINQFSSCFLLVSPATLKMKAVRSSETSVSYQTTGRDISDLVFTAGRAIAQAVSRWLPTAAARVQTWV